MTKHEEIFRSCVHLAKEVELMLELRFLYIPDPPDSRQIAINKDLRDLKMIPLARGMPSMLMYVLVKNPDNKIRVGEFKKKFESNSSNIFFQYLLETINQRPDLFILERGDRPRDNDVYLMNIRLNPKICKDFIVYDYNLRDSRKFQDLHLRKDYIDSISQFTN